MAITHGCVRMYPEDVAALFPLIPVGTKVWLINEPVKVAFVDGELLMEAHPPVDEEGQNTTDPDLNLLSQKLDQALGNTTAAIHWDFAKEALQAANGIPTVVGLQADLDTGPASDPAAPPPPAPTAAAPPAALTTTAPTTGSTAPTSVAAPASAPSPPVTVTLGSPQAGPAENTASSAASPSSAVAPDPQPLHPTRDADASPPRSTATSTPQQ
jgi:hypothetical protein